MARFTPRSTFEAQVNKQCKYEMVVNTGPSKGPKYKLWVTLTTFRGYTLKTNNVVRKWGDMGHKHTYFLPNSSDRFKANGPCLEFGFCNILTGGGKEGEIKPHWYINNITVVTKGDGVSRLNTFRFNSAHDVAYTNPPVNYGDCP